jgi:hypothetical protein
MEKFNYAVCTAEEVEVIPALKLARNPPVLFIVVFPVKDECVDYGSHRHLPDSMQSERISQ